jgi:hypothetical protein
MVGWWYSMTPQQCACCGGSENSVNVRTRRCLPCDGVTFRPAEGEPPQSAAPKPATAADAS